MIDLHTHSTYSDGTDSVGELVVNAARAGLSAIALTDHDTMEGVRQAQELGTEVGVEVLRGMEISTHLQCGPRERSVHLLGYGCRDDDPSLSELLDQMRASRRERVPETLRRLATLGVVLEEKEVQRRSGTLSPGRPHIADAMVARGYVANREEAFATLLKEGGPAYVRRVTPTLAQGITAINQACGVAVIAHPWGRGLAHVLTKEVLEGLATDLGLFGLEANHVDHTDPDRLSLATIAAEIGLVATGSSDYHGTGKTKNPLGVYHTAPEVYAMIRAEITKRGGHL